ncbi:putative oxidoreductase,short chain dehydrogenase [Thozetella sp. PMI_491]|nr:putative oxidoreductase,short chain dehydrogenase [Thozetella sp. PMI_491]
MSWFADTPGPLVAIGAATCLYFASYYSSVFWLYLRPSSFSRYCHARNGRPPWALVTGATGGIGNQLCRELASRGFNVVLHGRSQSKVQRAQEELARTFPDREFRTLVADASLACAGAEEVSKHLAASLAGVDLTVVINNAGGSVDRTFGTLDAMTSERLIGDTSVNAVFPMLLIRAAIPVLQRNAPGLIINIGSLADLGAPLLGSYPSSKTYLMKLNEVLNREMRLTGRDIEVLGIRVANVYGTAQSITDTQNIFAPDASVMAKAILARVGCGKNTVVGYWAHALQAEAFKLLPGFVADMILTDTTRHLATTEQTKED